MSRHRSVIVALILLAAFASAAGQSTRRVIALGESRIRVANGEGTRVQTLELDSGFLKRKVWMNVLLPEEYFDPNQSARRYPAIYLLHGLGGRYDNWTTKSRLAESIGGRPWIVITPEGADGWYTDSSTVSNDKFETYFIEEVIPEIDRRFRTIAEGRARAVAGLSMGGYGAIKFGLEYPDMFSLVGSFSGAFDATSPGPKLAGLKPSIDSVFGPEGSKTRSENDIFRLIREASSEKLKSLPFIYLDCGTEDPFWGTNRNFAALLFEKKVPHEYRQLPGGHSWDHWDRQLQEFLRVADKRLQ